MFKNGMRPVHPGEVLREDFLKPLGMSANALARALSVPAPRINDVVRERKTGALRVPIAEMMQITVCTCGLAACIPRRTRAVRR